MGYVLLPVLWYIEGGVKRNQETAIGCDLLVYDGFFQFSERLLGKVLRQLF